MKAISYIFSLCLLLAATGKPASAIVFDFFWTGDPSADPNLVEAGDPSASAIGTIEINAAPGESFGPAEVGALSIFVSANLFPDTTFTNVSNIQGIISTDGQIASLTSFFVSRPDLDRLFGCVLVDCDDFFGRNIDIYISFGNVLSYTYNSTANAQASFALTAVAPIPLPVGGLLLLTGLGGLIATRRFRD